MIAEKLTEFALAPVAGHDAREMMRLSLFDWAACCLAGADEPVSQIVRQMVLAEGGQGAAGMLGGGQAPPRSAALVNGTVSHALDYDDTHFDHIGHPSVAVIPAALAVAGDDFEAFLDACLVGAELSIRVGVWLGRDHYQTGFHQTATAGAFGATAAVGRLLGLNPAQMAQAFGLVATRASGLKSQFGTMGKPFNAGVAAANGVEAALLSQAGFISNPAALDGPQGFGPTHAGQGDLTAFDTLGRDWRFQHISHKFHACCHGLHAMLEALAEITIDVDNVKRVEVTTHPRWLRVCNIEAPVTGLEAKFSYRHTAAMALAGLDTGGMASFSDATAQDPKLGALREKVQVETDESLTEMQARVRVTAGGAVRDAIADLAAPMSFETRAAKLRAKAQCLLDTTQANALWAAVGTGDMTELSAALFTC